MSHMNTVDEADAHQGPTGAECADAAEGFEWAAKGVKWAVKGVKWAAKGVEWAEQCNMMQTHHVLTQAQLHCSNSADATPFMTESCTMFWTALIRGLARRPQSGVASSSCATALFGLSPAVPGHTHGSVTSD